MAAADQRHPLCEYDVTGCVYDGGSALVHVASLTVVGAQADGAVRPSEASALEPALRNFSTPASLLVAQRVAGTVWDDVVATGARYPGTEVPRSFRLGLDDGTEVWVHPNATEHLAERVLNGGATGPVTTQSQIRSLQTAVSEVNRQGVSLGQMYNVNGWQLQFNIRSTDDLVVVNHALYTG